MAIKTRGASRKGRPEVTSKPYAKYASSPLWKRVTKAIEHLASNGDIREMTSRDYVVGYLCKVLAEYKRRNNPTTGA